jgi:hypothetical protein
VYVSGLKGGEAKRMACNTSLRHLKLVPFGAVATRLNVSDETVDEVPALLGQVILNPALLLCLPLLVIYIFTYVYL